MRFDESSILTRGRTLGLLFEVERPVVEPHRARTQNLPTLYPHWHHQRSDRGR